MNILHTIVVVVNVAFWTAVTLGVIAWGIIVTKNKEWWG